MKTALNFSKNFKIMKKRKVICKCDCEDDIPPIEEQFNDIMENFDFKHVRMMMDWDKSRVDYDDDGNHTGYHQWETFHRPADPNDIEDLFDPINHRVPTIEELKKDAERLLKSAIRFHKVNPRCRFYMTATGPFKVTCRYGILELECIFASWSCD